MISFKVQSDSCLKFPQRKCYHVLEQLHLILRSIVSLDSKLGQKSNMTSCLILYDIPIGIDKILGAVTEI